MASGKFGSAALAANTVTLLYTVPAGVVTTLNLRYANRSEFPTQVRTAIGTGASPTDGDWISYGQTITGNAILEEQGIVLSGGEKVWVWATNTNISVRAHGFESPI